MDECRGEERDGRCCFFARLSSLVVLFFLYVWMNEWVKLYKRRVRKIPPEIMHIHSAWCTRVFSQTKKTEAGKKMRRNKTQGRSPRKPKWKHKHTQFLRIRLWWKITFTQFDRSTYRHLHTCWRKPAGPPSLSIIIITAIAHINTVTEQIWAKIGEVSLQRSLERLNRITVVVVLFCFCDASRLGIPKGRSNIPEGLLSATSNRRQMGKGESWPPEGRQPNNITAYNGRISDV